ncbi:phosphotransferase family protein [Salicibibacter halophilus]|uniref:phosphotransferase family protein n=1 Tax=Salicibibacter halophilus TaxID=2502791 RepID=UPI00135B1F8D|nr:phosphotransferase family protein [Salicibibacter halophilus]
MPIEKAEKSINWKEIENYIHNNIEALPDERMEVKKFTEGYSNLTYMIKIGDWEAVLRRPPFGYTPPKAHDMEREFKVLEKVHPVFPLAPKPYMYCEDSKIMDKHFYIMEKRTGVVIDDELPQAYEQNEKTGKQISEAVIRALVDLQKIDVNQAGLNYLGKPEGYLNRQVHGWIKRLKESKTNDINFSGDIEKWLINNIPKNNEISIVHNDFKLNNILNYS